MSYRLSLHPSGHLHVEETTPGDATISRDLGEDGSESAEAPAWVEAFRVSSAQGLLALVSHGERGAGWTAELGFWREFAVAHLTAVAHAPELAEGSPVDSGSATEPPPGWFQELTLKIPAMRGAEYASLEVFARLWGELDGLARAAAKAAGGWKPWLAKVHPALHLLGKVTFHLAENKRSVATPFAFMATYTHRLSASEKPVHLPLGRALQEYAGARNQKALRSLLEPVQRAAERSEWVRQALDSHRVFQPQAWSPVEAYVFLKEVPTIEDCGIVTRIPDWWKGGRGPRPQVRVRVGENVVAGLGQDRLLEFSMETALDGEPLTEEEWRALTSASDGLVQLRGRWVEADRERLQGALEHWKRVEKELAGTGVPFSQAMRLLSGVRLGSDRIDTGDASAAPDWSEVVAGGWLREALNAWRQTAPDADFDLHRNLRARLRPYQEVGVRWLRLLQELGLGACLADDMGLGKTLQVIALLQHLKDRAAARTMRKGERKGEPRVSGPALLVAPASLLANWRNEVTRFAPGLRMGFAHPAEGVEEGWREGSEAFVGGKDLIVTTYGQAARLDWLATREWALVVLDEAQAIKNPGARQTRAVKRLRARARIALSGTPVENRLGDLWSLYDFLNPGLLGSATEFSRYVKGIRAAASPDFAPLRRLVRPYLLRRLKTDPSIVPDLPEKTELTAYCGLSRKQAGLYARSVEELAEGLESSEPGIQRRGLVLAFLMRFKQICNHPSHWLGDGEFAADDSGKFGRLTELAEEIASRQEKVLVFTQFKEMTGPLAAHLAAAFGRAGLMLHGSTPVRERPKLVAAFEREDGPPFFVLSLKAGGTGLNLTAANHVIHFDRWWNPAVENQATDRAFRIGQRRNVLVHKFVCRGTVEERIDALIAEKRALADSVLGGEPGAETLLTEMSDEDLLQLVALDMKTAGAE
ncbi:MAG: DEAD/DEAH box helicase [Verrucomicrobiae bacterium]|nr:DEAD/DEAH box helicase [Verrucomicrobiae bacterium]